MIWAVRDPIEKQERVKEHGQVRYETVVADAGVEDKRLMVVEPEFANVLKQTERQGNTLSVTIRQAWDTGAARVPDEELPGPGDRRPHLDRRAHHGRGTEALPDRDGDGQRVRKPVPVVRRPAVQAPAGGGRADEAGLARVQADLRRAVEFARGVGEVRRDDEARELWHALYEQLAEDRPGVAGSLLGRGEAHVMRLAMIYALLDCSPLIRAEHLAASAALWDYSEQSVLYVFGDATGDPTADDVLRLLRASPGGVSRTEISDFLGRNVRADRLNAALGVLLRARLARSEKRDTGGQPGRPAEVWFPTTRS